MCKDTKIPRILQINLPFTLLFGVNKRYKNALPPVFSQGLALGVDGEDVLAALDVGQAHEHLAVEAAGAQPDGRGVTLSTCRAQAKAQAGRKLNPASSTS